MPGSGHSKSNRFASSASPNNAGEAQYFGEYREPQGCFNACFSGNSSAATFLPQHHNIAVTTTILSQAKDELKQTEEYLASEFNKLSFQERAKALEDVHCVAPLGSSSLAQPDLEPLPPEEQDPEHLNKLFNEFEDLVQKENNDLYNMAALQNPEYLRDPVIRLMFLRANFYKPAAAVKQLMGFLKYKAEYFGKDTLGRDITIDDMNQEDTRMMHSGMFHIQGKKDKSGRVVTVMLNDKFGQFDAATIIRVAYYMWFNILIRMPGVQNKGMTAVYYDNVPPGDEHSLPSVAFLIPLISFSNTLPYRYSSVHFCLKNTTSAGNGGGAMRMALNNSTLGLLTRGFPHHTRCRMKIHTGSDMELLYQIQAYGMDLATFPIDVRSGNVKPDELLNKWYYDYHGDKLPAQQTEKASLADTNAGDLFDDLDLDKTLQGEVDFAQLDDLEIDWDLENSKKDDPNDSLERSQTLRVTGSEERKGWFQSLVFGLSANDRTPIAAVQQSPSFEAGTLRTDDVLLGRGKNIHEHPGNIHFRKFLEEHRDLYEATPRHNKTLVATQLTQILTSKGIRFLKQDQDKKGWVIADLKEAEEKIKQLFRSTLKAPNPSQAGSETTSSIQNNLGQPMWPTRTLTTMNAVEPSPDDILLGRGKNVQYHPGNINFRNWLEDFRDAYDDTPRHKKALIATGIIQKLSSDGIRFLKQGEDRKSWVVADSKEAEEKIKQLFRSRRKKQQE